MIRTTITPTQSNFNVAMTFPNDYLGAEIEIIAFKKDEGMAKTEKTSKKFTTFDTIKIDTIGYKFDREEANAR